MCNIVLWPKLVDIAHLTGMLACSPYLAHVPSQPELW
jgi:hypothetical protein